MLLIRCTELKLKFKFRVFFFCLCQIVSMLDMIRNSIKDTPEAAALFYDELARIVQLGGIDPKIEVHSNFPQHSVPAASSSGASFFAR